MAYGDLKYLPTRRASDKVSFDKMFDNAKNPKYDGNWRGTVLMFNKYFDKRSATHNGTTVLIQFLITNR